MLFAATGCKGSYELQDNWPSSVSYKVYHHAVFSTVLKGMVELQGTIFQTDSRVNITKNGNSISYAIRPLKKIRKGWNKSLIVEEIARQLPLQVKIGDNEAFSFAGYDSLYPALLRASNSPIITQRLLASADTSRLKAVWRDRWRLLRFLPDGVWVLPKHADFSKLNLETISPDSAVVDRMRVRSGRQCLEYSIYYTRQDSARLDMEQLFVSYQHKLNELQFNYTDFYINGSRDTRVFKAGLWQDETFKGEWRFSLDLATKLPCHEYRRETADLIISDPLTLERLKVTLFRYAENVFEYSKPD